MSQSSTGIDGRERQVKVAAVVVGVFVILYGVLVAGQILAPFVLFLGGFVVYLAWRFVRAHERLADAAERIAVDGGVGAGGEFEGSVTGPVGSGQGVDSDTDTSTHSDTDANADGRDGSQE